MTQTVLLLSVLAICAAASVSGAGLIDVSLGKCVDNKEDLNRFKVELFLGKWYENATLNRLPYTDGRCATVQYALNLTDDTVIVKQTETVDDKEVDYYSKLYKINVIEYYRYFNIYENTENLPYQPNLKLVFKLLGTDYNCWAVVYTCIGEPAIHKEIVTVLLRTREQSCLNETTNNAVGTLISKVLAKDFASEFSFNNHTDCKVEEQVVEEQEERAENDVQEPETPATDEKKKPEGEKPAAAGEKGPAAGGEKGPAAGGENGPRAAVKNEKKEKTGGGEKTEENDKTAPEKDEKDEKTEEKDKTAPAKDQKDEKTEEKDKTTPEKDQKDEKTEEKDKTAQAQDHKTARTEEEHPTTPTEPAKKHKKKATKTEPENQA